MQGCACVKTVLMGINSLWLLLFDGVGEWTVGKMVNTLFCGKEGSRRLYIFYFFNCKTESSEEVNIPHPF